MLQQQALRKAASQLGWHCCRQRSCSVQSHACGGKCFTSQPLALQRMQQRFTCRRHSCSCCVRLLFKHGGTKAGEEVVER
jgi:hypothetical protein